MKSENKIVMYGQELTPLQARFVDEYLIDLSIGAAARRAGSTANQPSVAGNEFLKNPMVNAAVSAAMKDRAERVQVTQDMVVAELKKLGFSDIRRAVRWRGNLVREEDNPDGGETLVVKEIVTNHVELIDSDNLDDDTAAAIAEISQNESGGVRIKFHDKRASLVDLGRHLGMFKDNLNLGGKLEIETTSARDRIASRVAALGRDKAVDEDASE